MDTIPGTDHVPGVLPRKDAAAALGVTLERSPIGPRLAPVRRLTRTPTGGKVFYMAADVLNLRCAGGPREMTGRKIKADCRADTTVPGRESPSV